MANTKKAILAKRAWGVLRIAFLWARRGGSIKRVLMARSIRVAIKNVGRASGVGSDGARIRYLDREFSFGETPAFSFRMRRPASLRMPCIGAPAVDLDEEEDDWMFCKGNDEGEKDRGSDSDWEADEEEEEEEEEGGIDSKAEEFIANFYEQMKMQRQASLLPYNEMLHGGVC